MIHKIVDALESFADAIVELDEEQLDLIEYVESIDEDLSDINSSIFFSNLDNSTSSDSI